MDLFAEIIVSLLPVMIVCRLAVSKSCTGRSGVDIVLVRRPSGDLLENDCVLGCSGTATNNEADFQLKMIFDFSRRQYRDQAVDIDDWILRHCLKSGSVTRDNYFQTKQT